MLIREKAAGNEKLVPLSIPKNLTSELIQRIMPYSTKAHKIIRKVRTQEVRLGCFWHNPNTRILISKHF